MTLDKLSESLTKVVKKITFATFIDEKFVKEIVRDIQRALLSADVNVKLVFDLSKRIEERALKEKPKGLGKKEHVLRIVYEELVKLVGKKKNIPLKAKIMLVGIQGSGKTTTVAKLAKFYLKKGLKPCVIACDTYRPAAYEQLQQLLEPINVRLFGSPDAKNPIEVLEENLEKAKKYDVVIVDTAGRHKSEKELFEEMKKLASILQPDEKFLVIDSTIGQRAREQAKAFHEAIGITGVILTKLDGSAKGGGALSAVAETGAPIVFIGVGEKIDDFEPFDPDRFISRLLGMGDLQSLMEKVKEVAKEKDFESILKGDFTLLDLQEQLEGIAKLGKLGSIIKMIPGISMMLNKEHIDLTEKKIKKYLTILNSMTVEERLNPKVLNSSRIRRIAMGSGTSIEEVRELINYYKTMKKAIKSFRRGAFRGKFPFKIKI